MSICDLMDISMSVEEPRGDQSAGAWRKRSRRKWSEAERREIVLASFAAGAQHVGGLQESRKSHRCNPLLHLSLLFHKSSITYITLPNMLAAHCFKYKEHIG